MHKYLLKRLLLIPPTLFGAAILVFGLMRLVPGDVCLVKLLGEGTAVSEEMIQQCRDEHHLDDPLYEQFGVFLVDVVTLDFGNSMWTGKPVEHEIGLRFELTLQLALMTLPISIIIAIPLGVISAVKRQTWMDYVVRTFAIAGEAVPSFWLGIMIIICVLGFFAVRRLRRVWFGELTRVRRRRR